MAAALATETDLARRVVVVVEQLVTRMERSMQVMMALRSVLMAEGAERPPDARPPGPPAFVLEANRQLAREPDRPALRPARRTSSASLPTAAALVLRSLVFGAWHPGMPARRAPAEPRPTSPTCCSTASAPDRTPRRRTADAALTCCASDLAPVPDLAHRRRGPAVRRRGRDALPAQPERRHHRQRHRHRRHGLHPAHRGADARHLAGPDRLLRRRRLVRRADRDGFRPRPARGAVPPGRAPSRPARSSTSARPR